MRVLIVGYGYMGEIRKQIVEQNSETELSAVCDPFVNRETMDIACAYYDDYRKPSM